MCPAVFDFSYLSGVHVRLVDTVNGVEHALGEFFSQLAVNGVDRFGGDHPVTLARIFIRRSPFRQDQHSPGNTNVRRNCRPASSTATG